MLPLGTRAVVGGKGGGRGIGEEEDIRDGGDGDDGNNNNNNDGYYTLVNTQHSTLTPQSLWSMHGHIQYAFNVQAAYSGEWMDGWVHGWMDRQHDTHIYTHTLF